MTATSASGGMTYCLVSTGRGEDIILQAGTLDQAPIIHQVMLDLPLIRETGLFDKECQYLTKICSIASFKITAA